MDVKYINPFINSSIHTMETMLGLKPDRLPPHLKVDADAQGDISGIIGFADKSLSGAVALSFPMETALRIYEMMMGESVSRINSDVEDCIGELANIVTGTAKSEFYNMNVTFHISIPTVVVGKDHRITHRAGTPVVVIPFNMEGGLEFTLEVSMKMEGA